MVIDLLLLQVPAPTIVYRPVFQVLKDFQPVLVSLDWFCFCRRRDIRNSA